jgi:hypothetical protein
VSQIAAAIEDPEAIAMSASQGVIVTNVEQVATGITGDRLAIATIAARAAMAAIAILPPIVSAAVWAYLIR